MRVLRLCSVVLLFFSFMCFDADAQASKVVSKAASKLFKSTGSKVAVGAACIKAIENLAGKSSGTVTTCPDCNGKGGIRSYGQFFTCSRCGGTGRIQSQDKTQIILQRCSMCGGNGGYCYYGVYYTCPQCQGRGSVKVKRQISFTGSSKYDDDDYNRKQYRILMERGDYNNAKKHEKRLGN